MFRFETTGIFYYYLFFYHIFKYLNNNNNKNNNNNNNNYSIAQSKARYREIPTLRANVALAQPDQQKESYVARTNRRTDAGVHNIPIAKAWG